HGGHIPRLLRCFDIPAVDAIWRQIHPLEGAENGFFPRFASSAAAQNGSVLAASESFAVYGAGLTYDEMRWALYFQAVRGINLFNFMVISYGNHEFTASQERPCFQAEMPGSGDIAPFNDFTARLSYIAAVGKASNRAALYYPIRDIWAGGDTASAAAGAFDRIGRSLERLQCGFDIIDDDILRSADIDNGRFIAGTAIYDTVILPECRYIPPDVCRRLAEFEQLGGQLFFNGASGTPAVKMYPVVKSLRSSRRETDDGDIVFIIYNEGTEHIETEIALDSDNIYTYELDPHDGSIYSSNAKVGLSLGSGEGKIFLCTSKKLETDRRRFAGDVFASVDSFEVKPLRRFRLTADGIRSVSLDDQPITLTCGDWSGAFGGDFSGDVMYEAFAECGSDDFILDLGEVKYTCEVILDGVSLGIRCMTPYTYFVPGARREPLSKLQIRVSNTAANEYTSKEKEVAGMFSPAQIGPYHARTLKFERDTPGGGLIGPVTLRRVIYK
ncbi:MAG: hypothetical protein PHZ09_08910, partial [Eubacteriales bacterium]|nr:hypothetical protein [Eubacteriales bacterium]